MSVEYRPALSAEFRPRCRPVVSVDYRPTLSAECRSIIGRGSVVRVSTRTIGRMSADTWSSNGQNSTQVCRPSVATIGRSVGLHSVDPSTDILDRHLGRHSTKCRSISCPRVGRDVGRVLAEISADSVGRVSVECRSSIGQHIDRHTPLTYSSDILHQHSQPTTRPTLGR